MELACFGSFPNVPSLSGSMVQQHGDLLASTRGAGTPERVIRIEFELFDEESPRTCANFRHLCAGQSTSRQGQTYVFQGLTPCYRGTYFHKIIPRLCAQGGDLTMRVAGGANHFSAFGRGWFADEYKRRCINEVGLLLMANNGPNSNGSQFFITTSEAQEKALNGRHVCFGRIVRGLDDFMQEVAPYGDINGYPSRFVVVVDCGVGPLPETLGATDSCAEAQSTHDESPIAAVRQEEEEEGEAVKTATEAEALAERVPEPTRAKAMAKAKQAMMGSERNSLHVSFKEGH
ncbi:cyclophilin [Trypanosoma grayi]|uniref:cyclophilin n=1 Tax=Trypanosoma grayi TaxID=71804 RepID=UPI0004F431FC|nr:cyclophilin [Trypanosoma grayi]KEG08622.1 cyclophilin [Trypanosoma grayi]